MQEKTLKFQEMFIEKILSGEKVFTTRKPDITYKKGDILTCLNAKNLKPFGKIEILELGFFEFDKKGLILTKYSPFFPIASKERFAEKEGFNSYDEFWDIINRFYKKEIEEKGFFKGKTFYFKVVEE